MTASAGIDGRIDFYGTYTQLVASNPANLVPLGTQAWCSDLGEIHSNGTSWVTNAPSPLVIGSLPLCILPTSSGVTATGTCTVGTTLPITAGAGYFYVPANYLATVSAAGWYYGTIASGTSVTLFNNIYSGTGQPTIPASPTAFAGLSGGTPTGSTGAQTFTVNIPAGCMGPNGECEVKFLATFNSSANNKVISHAFGALNLYSVTATTTTSLGVGVSVRNSGIVSVQTASLLTGDGYVPATQALGRGSVNTAAAVAYVITMNNAAATDFIILESYSIKISSR